MGRKLLVAVVVLSLSLTACKAKPKKPPSKKDNDPAIACVLTVNNPHRSGSDSSFVDGKATVTCSGGTVDKLTVNAVLERSRDGKPFVALPALADWKNVETGTNVKPNSKRTAAAAIACTDVRPGDKFRTRGSASGTVGGKSVKVTLKGNNPNPEGGMEVVCL